MSTYILTEEFQPIKEAEGELRNITDGNIEYAITNGGLPPKDTGRILEPKRVFKFNLYNGAEPYHHIPMPHPPRPYHNHFPHHHHQVLFIRATHVSEDNPTPTCIVQGRFSERPEAYNVSGVTMYQPNRIYDIHQPVIHDKKLYYSIDEHLEGNAWDNANWSNHWVLVANGVEKVTVNNDTLTVIYSDGTIDVLVIDNVKHADTANQVDNAITLKDDGTGDVSGTTYNGSSGVTVSYNSIGAAPTDNPTFTGTVDCTGKLKVAGWEISVV